MLCREWVSYTAFGSNNTTLNSNRAGQYQRMKAHMTFHVDSRRSDMFKESCDEVKNRLTHMCRQVEEIMANKADEVFVLMRRDYCTVFNGAQVPQGQIMPKLERQVRAAITDAIEKNENWDHDDEDGKAIGVTTENGSMDLETSGVVVDRVSRTMRS